MARDSWYRLDNVGRFYSSQAGRSAQTVFRIAAEMSEDVDPDSLQRAVDRAVDVFPGFNVTLRSGLFWHYLEQAGHKPKVSPESLPVCSRMHAGPRSVLMRVSHFGRRINLEVSHIVSDGRGTLEFFKAVVAFYVEERHGCDSGLASYSGREDQKTEDSFSKNYDRAASASTRLPKAYRIHGWRDAADPEFLECHMSASAVHAAAKGMGVGVTSLLVAAIVCAIRDGMPAHERARNRAICLDVPVDLRRFFGSNTLRNFFGLAYVSYFPGKDDEPLAAVAASIQGQLSEATQPDVLKRRMNRMVKLQRNPALRVAPLFMKDLALALAGWVTARDVTTTASNLGRIEMPEGAAPYVRSVVVLTSTSNINFVMSTFEDDLSVGVSSVLVSDDIERRFVETFDGLGIGVRVNSNKAALKGGHAGEHAATGAASVFPEVAPLRRSKLARGVLGVVTLALLAATATVCAAVHASPWRCALACVAIAVNYVFVRNMIVHSPDVFRLLQRYHMVLVAMAFIWFFATWDPSVSTFVIPCLCIAGTLFDAVLLAVFRSRFVEDYAKYLLFVILLGMLPLSLFFTGAVEWPVMPVVSAVCAALLALGLFAFARVSVAAEARKLFDA